MPGGTPSIPIFQAASPELDREKCDGKQPEEHKAQCRTISTPGGCDHHENTQASRR
jgi:hypothetical protein